MNKPNIPGIITEAKRSERERIIKRIENQICFDALADTDGRCNNHNGKCHELRALISSLQEENK